MGTAALVAQNSEKHSNNALLTEIPNHLVFSDVKIPFELFSEDFKTFLTTRHQADVDKALGTSFEVTQDFTGKLKSDSIALDALQTKFTDCLKKNPAVVNKLPSNYKYFGNGNYLEILKQLLKTNPFFCSALHLQFKSDSLEDYEYVVTSYFPLSYRHHQEIKTTTEGDGKEGKNTTTEEEEGEEEFSTRFSRIIEVYLSSFPRVNISFHPDSWEITSYQVYVEGKDVTPKYSQEKAIHYLLFALCFYAELQHVSLHIFNLLMVIGMLYASRSSSFLFMFPWINGFFQNVILKYNEMAISYLKKEGNGFLIGGKGGFKPVSQEKVLSIMLEEIIKPWLHLENSNRFVESFLFHDIPSDYRNDLCEEFLKHINLVQLFTIDAISTLNEYDRKGVDGTNRLLKEFMIKVGINISTISNTSQWIELMSTFGIFHGCSLSYTRLFGMIPILSCIDESLDYFTAFDEKHVILKLGTNLLLKDDCYVYSSKLMELNEENPLNFILRKYEKLSNQIKKEYWNRIVKDSDFSNYGWIWTDYCPDLIDNKQFTLTSYV
jgi:hypothetical protein